MGQAIVVDLLRDAKDRKNTLRFNAVGNEEQQKRASVSMVYVQQSALKAAFGEFPDRVRVTIEKL